MRKVKVSLEKLAMLFDKLPSEEELYEIIERDMDVASKKNLAQLLKRDVTLDCGVFAIGEKDVGARVGKYAARVLRPYEIYVNITCSSLIGFIIAKGLKAPLHIVKIDTNEETNMWKITCVYDIS